MRHEPTDAPRLTRHRASRVGRLLRRGDRTLRNTVFAVGIIAVTLALLVGIVAWITGSEVTENIKDWFVIVWTLVLLGLFMLQSIDKLIFRMRSRKPRQALKRWAAARGWGYQERGRKSEASSRLAMAALGSLNNSKTEVLAGNTVDMEELRPRHLRDMAVGRVESSHGEESALTLTCTFMKQPESVRRFLFLHTPRQLPPLVIRDATFTSAWVNPDLTTEWATFNRRWLVTTSDARSGSGMVHPRIMQLLSEMPRTVVRLDITGDWLVAWLDPVAMEYDLDAAVHLLVEFERLIPRWLINEK